MDKVKAEALARARALIAERIAGYCRDLPPGELDALLDRMAGIQCKYDSMAFTMPRTTPVKPRDRD